MSYELAWAIYAAACLVAILCFFGFTRPIKNTVIRWALRLPIIAACFTPVYIDGTEQIWFAPSIAAVALDLIAKDFESAYLHALPLVVLLGLSLVLGVIIGLLVKPRTAKTNSQTTHKTNSNKAAS